jgi:hypothetical protein
MLDNFPSYLDKYPKHIKILAENENTQISFKANILILQLEKFLNNEIAFKTFREKTQFSVTDTDIQDLKSIYYIRNRLIEILIEQGKV